MVLQVVIDVLDYHMDVAAAVSVPRLHHQWMPMKFGSSTGFPPDAIAALEAKGHVVKEPLGQTSANSIAVTENGLFGAPDPRTRGDDGGGAITDDPANLA